MQQLKDIFKLKNRERALSKKVNDASLLGEISFNRSQFKSLEENLISKNVDLSTLINKYPTTLAFYLVQAGIYYYKEGEYWPNLRIADDKSTAYLSLKLSTFFENYLEENNLISLGLSGPYSTIDDILIHGFVPNCDLSKYFDFVEKANRENTTPEELILELNLLRKKEKEYKLLEEKQSAIIKRLRVCSVILQNWKDLDVLTYISQKTVNNQDTAEPSAELRNLLEDLKEVNSRYRQYRKDKHKVDKTIEKLQKILFSRPLDKQELLYLQNHSISDFYNLFTVQEKTKGILDKIIASILNFIPFLEFSSPSVNSLPENLREYPLRDSYPDTNTEDLVSYLASYKESLINADEVRAEMEELEDRKRKIDTRLQKRDVKLKELLTNEVKKIRMVKLIERESVSQEELIKEYRNLIKIGRDERFVNKELKRLRKERKFIELKKESIHPRLNIYLPPSIRNFLLFGKEPAQEFYKSTLKLVDELGNNRFQPEIDLPLRIANFAKDWWSKKEKSLIEAEREEAGKKAFSAKPYLAFDKNIQRIFLNFPSQEFRQSKSHLQLKLNGEVIKKKLRTYEINIDSMETENIEDISIEKPSNQYKVEITTGEKILKSWTINAFIDESPFIAFDYRTGKRISANKLTQKKTWLIYDRRISLVNPIQAEGLLTGAWHGYKYAIPDLSDSEKIIFKIGEEKLLKFPIAKSKMEFELHPLTPRYSNIASNGNPIYTHTFPELKIINPDNLSNYYIFLQNLENDLTVEPVSFEKLQDHFIKDKHSYRLDLNELFTQVNELLAGTYLLKIKGYFPQQNQVEEFRFSYIPGLEVQFNKDIYPPVKNSENENIELKIKPPDGMKKQTELNGNDHKRKKGFVQFDLSYDEAPFYTELKTKENKRLALKVTKPVLTWEFTNNEHLDWVKEPQVRIREIWHEDYFKSQNGELLKVCCPQNKTDKAWLGLKEEEHEKNSDRSFQNLFEFNLSEFNDSLRQSENALSTFLLKTYNREEQKTLEFPLFRIRHKWEVDLTLLTKKIIKDKLHLSLEYETKGVAEEPVVVLWSTSNSDIPKKIGECELTGKKSLELIEKIHKITPGNYRIHFIDKRITDESFPASLDSLNTYDFEIEPEELEELSPGTELILRNSLSDDEKLSYPLLTIVLKCAQLENNFVQK